MDSTIPPTEAVTRREYIDRQLLAAGWSTKHGNVIEEHRLFAEDRSGVKVVETGDSAYRTGDDFADYLLLGRDGKPIALVEAKRASRDALVAQGQAAEYADRVRSQFGVEPFIFLANGREIWYWDRERYPPRQITGFFTRDDLERFAFQRRYQIPLVSLAPKPDIVERLYQIEAIKRITERMTEGQRSFLLVMATGTGKTRTIIALIDLLMRARWVQRVLFLADRRALVQQALRAFKDHMPDETRARIEGGEVDQAARIHVATYPSMMQVYEQLSAGYYDLIVADESHRSIYNRYRALLQHFDAMQVGLTATPTDYIDHNTFDLFDCPDGLPTYYYDYDQAVKEGHLVDYRVYYARTNFQIEGISAGKLPPEIADQLAEQGIELGEIDFEGTELERRVTNTGTNDAIVREFMDNCRRDATGTLPAKTIFFAMSHRHALELYQSFNRLYPNLQRAGLAQVIDSQMERADLLLEDFIGKDMPRVAISVDMLDTGIDVPAIQNLVFAKPVFSQVKFWQMIGRGTRLWTDPRGGARKESFLIFDFWNNFPYFYMNPEGEVASQSEPLPVRLFRTRLDKLLLLRGQSLADEEAETRRQLQAMLAVLPLDNVNIRPHAAQVAALAEAPVWSQLDAGQMQSLKQVIAPLLRFLPDANLPTMTFELRTEVLANAWLAGDDKEVERVQQQVLDDLKRLPVNLQDVRARRGELDWVQSDGFWAHLDYARIMELQQTFSPLMRFRQRHTPEIIKLHLPDHIRERWIVYGPSGEGAYARTYQAQVEAHVKDLARQHPTLRKLQRNVPLSENDVQALVQTLDQADLFITETSLRQAYDQPDARLEDFVRHILGLSQLVSREAEINAAFERFIAAHPQFSARQILFLRTVRSQVIERTRLSAQELERPPFSNIGRVRQLFGADEIEEIVTFANRFVG